MKLLLFVILQLSAFNTFACNEGLDTNPKACKESTNLFNASVTKLNATFEQIKSRDFKRFELSRIFSEAYSPPYPSEDLLNKVKAEIPLIVKNGDHSLDSILINLRLLETYIEEIEKNCHINKYRIMNAILHELDDESSYHMDLISEKHYNAILAQEAIEKALAQLELNKKKD